MKGIKSLKLGLAGIAAGALLLAGGLLLVGQVSAISGSLSLSSDTAAPGEQATVELRSNVGGIGLGAWTVDISYTDQVSVVSCAPEQGGVCNPNFVAGSEVRITGASAGGVIGDKLLGSVTFECADTAGEAHLDLSVEVYADATIGDPQDIDETVTDGVITCEEPAAATATPIVGPGGGAGSETGAQCTNSIDDDGDGVVNDGCPAVGAAESGADCRDNVDDDGDGYVNDGCPVVLLAGPGDVGDGPSSNGGSDFSWLIASLSVVGIIALAGYSVLRVRTRNS